MMLQTYIHRNIVPTVGLNSGFYAFQENIGTSNGSVAAKFFCLDRGRRETYRTPASVDPGTG